MPFTPEELAEMARADAEIEAEFEAGTFLTNEEMAQSRQLDRTAAFEALTPERRKVAEYQRRYYAANKEQIAEYQRRYYAANKEQIAESKRRYYAANKEQIAESKQAIQTARKEAGLSQAAAGRLFGVTQATMCNWERVLAPDNWREVVAVLEAEARKGTPCSDGDWRDNGCGR